MTRHRFASIAWKEFIQMRRDRPTLAMMLGIPVIQLLVFGYAIRFDVRDLPMAVVDLSRTQERDVPSLACGGRVGLGVIRTK